MSIDTKTFRIDWYPHAALYDFSKLTTDHLAMLVQIINMIYIENGPIKNDPDHFARLIMKMTPRKAQKIINELIENKQIYITNDGKISKKMCEKQLKSVETLRKNSSKSGQKGAEKRWGIQQNQDLNNGDPIFSEIASTSTSTSITPYSPPQGDQKPNKRISKKERIENAKELGMRAAGYEPIDDQTEEDRNEREDRTDLDPSISVL